MKDCLIESAFGKEAAGHNAAAPSLTVSLSAFAASVRHNLFRTPEVRVTQFP